MIRGSEIAPGLWTLQNEDTGRNTIVLVEENSDAPAIAIDPGASQAELDALGKFVQDMGSRVGVLAFTEATQDHPASERWPGAIVIEPSSVSDLGAPQLPFPLAGWEIVPLSSGRNGFYNKKAGVLLPGLFMRNNFIPMLSAGADNYLEALEKIEALGPKIVVPQRGTAALGKREVKARLTTDRDYTQNLVRHVLTSKSAKHPKERVTAIARDIYEDYPFLEDHLENLARVWDEL